MATGSPWKFDENVYTMKLPNLFLRLTPSFRFEIVIVHHYLVTLLKELSIYDLIESSVSKQISLFS
jgi:hypothetical protein